MGGLGFIKAKKKTYLALRGVCEHLNHHQPARNSLLKHAASSLQSTSLPSSYVTHHPHVILSTAQHIWDTLTLSFSTLALSLIKALKKNWTLVVTPSKSPSINLHLSHQDLYPATARCLATLIRSPDQVQYPLNVRLSLIDLPLSHQDLFLSLPHSPLRL